jgi:hypothetical protein
MASLSAVRSRLNVGLVATGGALAAVALVIVAHAVLRAASATDCDNIAGACRRTRQVYALNGIGVIALGAGALCV